MRPRPAISLIAATATAVLSMRSSGRKTAPSPKCGPGACPRESGGRTCDRGHQAGIRLCQSALSRAEEEHASPARDLRAGQSVHDAPASIALRRGVVCPQPGRISVQTLKTAPARADHPVLWPANKAPCPHPCAGPLFRPSLVLRFRHKMHETVISGLDPAIHAL